MRVFRSAAFPQLPCRSSRPAASALYINGEFIGGCDIMKEMYQSGELQQMLEAVTQT